MFTSPSKGTPTAALLTGVVSDDQRGGDSAAGVADFFLGTFLGCGLHDSPEKSTLAFVRGVEAFVNHDVTNPEKRGRYQVALLASMQDNSKDVRPRSFARTHIEPADRPALFERLREQAVDPDTAFPKDINLVKVKGFKMQFASGMVLVGSEADLRERIHIRDETAAQQGVDVNDTIKTLSGR